MNAIVLEKYGPPDVLQLREVDKPTPKANEVLIRIYAAAVTATDPVDRKGEPFVARIFSGIRRPKHPIPGGMLAGVIEAWRPGVRIHRSYSGGPRRVQMPGGRRGARNHTGRHEL